MADERNLDGVIDRANQAHASVSQNIEKLQQLITQSGQFKEVAEFFDKVPEWSTEEGKKFFAMMENIKQACDSYGQVLGEVRRYVISTKAFAKDTADFATDIQEEDLEPDDIEDIFGDFTDSIDKMKESNKKVETMKKEFREVLTKLRDAQKDAAGGKVRGKENAEDADTKKNRGIGGTVVAASATVAAGVAGTSVAAAVGAPLVLVGFVYTFKSKRNAEKCKEWEKNSDFVLRRLDVLYSILDSITNDRTNALDQLSHSSNAIMDKSKRMTERKKPATSKYFKQKCIRLAEESATLQRTCIEYIRKDDEIRGIAGAMNQLSLK